MAVENAQLYQQAQQELGERRKTETELRRSNEASARRNRELALLNRVIAITTSTEDPRQVLSDVCRELALTFGVAQSAAALLDEGGETLTVIAEYRSPERPSALGMVIPVSNNPATLYVIKKKTPLALADAENDFLLASVRDIMRQRGVASLLLLPLIVNDRVMGTIGLDSAGAARLHRRRGGPGSQRSRGGFSGIRARSLRRSFAPE